MKIIRSNRKTLSLSVDDNLCVVVKAPYSISDSRIEAFVDKNCDWIEKAIEKKKQYLQRVNISTQQREELILKAKTIIPKRVEYYSKLMNVFPSSVKITSAKKRFGSCSSKNSLCFSYYLMLYPQSAVDYVVVHELAHIVHHNHSKEFYNLIEKYMPDFREREQILK